MFVEGFQMIMHVKQVSSLEINVEGTIWEQVSEELWSSFSFNKTVVIDIEMVECVGHGHTDLRFVTHTLVGAPDLSSEGGGILQVEHHNTGEGTLNFDFPSIFTNDGVHESIVTLLSESGWHSSLISSGSI